MQEQSLKVNNYGKENRRNPRYDMLLAASKARETDKALRGIHGKLGE
jgi:hypothetical protein